MKRKAKIKLVVIVISLALFGTGGWFGLNLLVARNLNLLHLAELGDHEGVAYVCKWDPKQARINIFFSAMGLSSGHPRRVMWFPTDECYKRLNLPPPSSSPLTSPILKPPPPPKPPAPPPEPEPEPEPPQETTAPEESADGKIEWIPAEDVLKIEIDPTAMLPFHRVGGVQGLDADDKLSARIEAFPRILVSGAHRCRHCFGGATIFWQNALQIAVNNDDLAITKELLRAGADPNKMLSFNDNNPMPSEEMKKLLRNYGWK